MTLAHQFKGWMGELMGQFAHKVFLDPSVYHSLNNLTLRTQNGTTQIDHVVVSRYGIFVVEAKNIDGWIFGDARSPQWTVVRHGRKYRMQNPLRQNYRHVKAITEFLSVGEDRLHSVVMLWGECEFKTEKPSNVLLTGYTSYIKGFVNAVFSDEEVKSIAQALEAGALPKTWATRREHLDSLWGRHNSTSICPKCGNALVLRTAKSGPKAGTQFYGCSGFPKCRHTAPCAENREGLRGA